MAEKYQPIAEEMNAAASMMNTGEQFLASAARESLMNYPDEELVERLRSDQKEVDATYDDLASQSISSTKKTELREYLVRRKVLRDAAVAEVSRRLLAK